MADFSEVPLELQLREAHHRIQSSHLGKGHKYAQFLSPMFLRQFPAIMDNQINVDWDCITGVFDQMPIFPITLIDTEILDYWCAHPAVWEVACNMQHSRCVLVMVCYTLVSGIKGKPAVIYGASFIYIPAHQAWTSLTDALSYLKHSKVWLCHLSIYTDKADILSPTPRGRYFTMLPINGNLDADCRPLNSFAAATLHMASREGRAMTWLSISNCRPPLLFQAAEDGADCGVCPLQGPSVEEHPLRRTKL